MFSFVFLGNDIADDTKRAVGTWEGFFLRFAAGKSPEVPPRVEYSITELGQSLMPHVIGLMEWATQNFENIVRDEGDL